MTDKVLRLTDGDGYPIVQRRSELWYDLSDIYQSINI